MTQRVVILGAGIGGVVAANELAERLGGKHEIVLVDQAQKYKYSPSYLWLLDGIRVQQAAVQPGNPQTARATHRSAVSPGAGWCPGPLQAPPPRRRCTRSRC